MVNYLKETASQTGGPYVHIGLIPRQAGFDIFQNNFTNVVAPPGVPGERIVIEGQVLDGTGAQVKDALLEIWQADAAGRYSHPHDGGVNPDFRGWGRAGTDFKTGLYRFETIKPGAIADAGGFWKGRAMAPHVTLWIAARGINIGLHTRLYFADEAEANAKDPVLNLVENPERRKTLLAERSDRDGMAVYRFDIRLQGLGETVFFDA
ncbi:MAG: protocatechuate 3,4-dioxygenase subunit alpha [Ferrovibrio sp.]|nr:protocatechuate 3,4-dioxygenase subunit alpha [Ferrovibrio sp.]MBP7063831.1 protocatechuate 3,4-dioxygenase subunit alpha [Ferrovibrio sp.]